VQAGFVLCDSSDCPSPTVWSVRVFDVVVLSPCTSCSPYVHSLRSSRAGKIPHELSKLPQLLGVYLYNNCFEGRFLRYLHDSCL
jgi:hypothetical protein